MFERKRKFTWWRIALISSFLIAMGAVMGKVVDRQIFAKNFGRSAAFIESVRPVPA